MKRGDVVLVHVPYVDGPGGKKRPAAVVQADEYNATLPHTIVAAISTNFRGVGLATQLPIDPLEPDGKVSGVLHKSAIRCDRLFTVERAFIGRTIGHLAPETRAGVEGCLRTSLGLQARSSPVQDNEGQPESEGKVIDP